MIKSIVMALLCAIACPSIAQEPDYLKNLAHYRPEQRVQGTIRVWGNNYIPSLMQQWEAGFQKAQPDVRFETNLKGSEAAMAGLYGGIADLAFIGREAYPQEISAYRERFGYAPFGVQISSGSFNTPHKTFALMVYVHRGNPISGLTMAQLQSIFGCMGPDGSTARTWGDIGLKGEWAQRPIHVYGYASGTGMARFFDRTVLHGTGKWNESLRAFDNGHDEMGEVINAGVYVLQALSADPDGIAFANPLYETENVRTVALARLRGGRYIEPIRYTAWTREYPLTRFTTVFMDRAPGKPLDPKLREFLRYILSWEGIGAVVDDGAYLPLDEKMVAQELKRLSNSALGPYFDK